jgi:hypothetical protein
LNGVDLLALPAADMLDVIHHLLVDDQMVTASVQVADDRVDLYSRAKVRADLEDRLDEAAPDMTGSPADADRATWGTGGQQQAALAALFAQVGPPAGGASSLS